MTGKPETTLPPDFELLTWIYEEQTKNSTVPVQLLLLRMAVKTREQDGDLLTMSTELSLDTFDRANLYRLLRELNRRGMVLFVDKKGEASHSAEEQARRFGQLSNEKAAAFVRLTEVGLQQALNLQPPEEEPEA